MNYKFLQFEMIEVGRLFDHPDALSMVVGAGDRAVLNDSINEVGLLEPLTVIAMDTPDGMYAVIDGVGRLRAASTGADEGDTIACMVVECDDVRAFVLNKNAMGRRRSTGSRLLCYVLAHAEHIITDVQGSTPAHLHDAFRFTAAKIAERLGVSRKDVGLASALVYCHLKGFGPDGEELDVAGKARITQVFDGVMVGELPIRRWRAAFAGLMSGSQPGEAGKARTDYAGVLERSLTSLGNTWAHWHEVEWEAGQAERVGSSFAEMVRGAPEQMRTVASNAIAANWSETDLKYLQMMIKRQQGR